ncbi:SusC/RagA family TonB-linked outer membrane protein [Chitinophaga qingshengii]|uniref:SusC/RagA family TonB-linked outer membrane protein n=1 Tax=Chitinophaga qingshengii TaxID=1569794 RepID=A0ABR7TKR7_9BACT|nr:SusC/RagA family TonB-linked outer membrane protein [Chitinophaga qingshengii]MBC9931081.1 SusC/RagA family TonB-linked outer membrane protein [Chitinophaga qingshengii]
MSKNYLRGITRCGMRMSRPLVMAAILLSAWPVRAQDTFPLNRKVTVKANNQPIAVVLSEIEKQTNLNFVYDGSQINKAQVVSIQANGVVLKNVLHNLFNDGVQYAVVGNQVIVKSTPGKALSAAVVIRQEQQEQNIRVRGRVSLRDSKGNMQQIPGVTVRVKGKAHGTHTDAAGKFDIAVSPKDILVVSFVGYKTVEMPVNGASSIVLDEDASKIKEVVVTGIYERTKESFTGSASTYTAKELKQIGNQNIVQSLRSLDPSFTVFENNLMGSNPNVMPNLEIRGKTSVLGLKEQFGTDPNQPLFILDGFETNLRTIIDLDINRVESVTILKDAASTAIYGSKAANGVIVIETKKPKPGELRVYYTTDNSVTIPDLHDYNLMDAAEKLEFERVSGRFSMLQGWTTDQVRQKELDQAYNERLAEVQRGVNTYWLSEPLRTGFTTGHSLYIEGGDNQMRYSAGLNYKKINGVMKGSGRDIGGANIKLVYRKNRLSFNNNLSINFFTANESTYGSFQAFAQASPYYRKRDENGNLQPYLERRVNGATGADTTTNPLWNASLGNFDATRNFSVVNNFMAEWEMNRDFRVRGRLGITKEDSKQEIFTDARNTMFAKKVPTERGSFTSNRTATLNYDGELTAIYGKLINERHQINAVGGWKLQQFRNTGDGYGVIGLPPGISSPAFAAGYPAGGKSSSIEATTRSTSAYLNAGYMLDGRYMADVNYRLDGSSVFGSNNFFTTSWSVGLSWNLHKEAMLQEVSWINFLKLRGSIGTPGNQNFSTYQSFTTYRYNTNTVNDFGIGAIIDGFGNPNLLWQKTLDKNIGADVILLDNRLRLNIDVYNRITDPLVAQINLPSSVGTSVYLTNLGKQVGNGYNFMFSVSPWYKPQERINWSINFSAKRENARFDNMANRLDALNKQNRSKNLERYYDGGSPTAIWAVRSAGIDPGTGKEVLIKKDGSLTFNYDADDEVVVGDSRPKLEGIAGTNFSYKGFTLGIYLRYRLGADVFNNALYDKVENINSNEILLNQDRRALYDRWKQPGDIARYRAIQLVVNPGALQAAIPPMTSRFVQRENVLAGESINMGYEFTNGVIKRWRMSYLRLNAYMNDIFRISSIKRERGIDYPFANTVSFSVSAGF